MAGITTEVLLGIMAADRLSAARGDKHAGGGGFRSYGGDGKSSVTAVAVAPASRHTSRGFYGQNAGAGPDRRTWRVLT